NNSLTHYTKGTPSPLRALTACTYAVSGSISLPSPGFFSPFPHGTGSLSVAREYLALEDGPAIFRPDSTCPALLFVGHLLCFSCTGLSPSMAGLSRPFHSAPSTASNWAVPRSLATTHGISVDFFSSGYLDVSVPRVRLRTLWIQVRIPPKRWVSPFGHPRIKACLPAPRGLSQATTSFIASYR